MFYQDMMNFLKLCEFSSKGVQKKHCGVMGSKRKQLIMAMARGE